MAPRKEDVEATILRRCIYFVFGLAGILAIISQAGFSSTNAPLASPLAARTPHGFHGGHGGHEHAAGHIHGDGGDAAAVEPDALAAGVDVLASLGEGLSVALRGAVLGHRIPSKVVRRSFRDEDTGALVEEEAAYFSVPEGEGSELADALRTEQEALVGSGRDAVTVDEIVLRLARASEGSGSGSGSGNGSGRAVEEGASEEETGSEETGSEETGSEEAGAVSSTGSEETEPAAPLTVATAEIIEWKQLVIPTRPGDWVKPEYLMPGERESVPKSPVLNDATAHSLNPPRALSELPPAEARELAHRLVIAIAMGVHSGKLGQTLTSSGDLGQLMATPPLRVLLPTFLPSAQGHHEYRFYFAYDHNDPVYEKLANRVAIEGAYAKAVEEENAKRWHPVNAVPGVIDGSSLVVNIYWVHCEYSGKPGWAHSDAVIAAVKEGADYVYRTNDDTEFPVAGDWADRFVGDLRRRSPTNLGVTGPTCNVGATWCVSWARAPLREAPLREARYGSLRSPLTTHPPPPPGSSPTISRIGLMLPFSVFNTREHSQIGVVTIGSLMSIQPLASRPSWTKSLWDIRLFSAHATNQQRNTCDSRRSTQSCRVARGKLRLGF